MTRAVLEKIGELGIAGLDAFFPPNYAYTRIWRPLLGLEKSKSISRRTFSAMMSRLVRQGLIERTTKQRDAAWSLTQTGKKRLIHYGLRHTIDTPKKDGIARLVIFDIPERERQKRVAIRVELAGLNFMQLQKSVWIGYSPLPQSFISLIDELNLTGRVHIFSVAKLGTISDTDGG